MPTLNIRNLAEEIHSMLRIRAAKRGHSMEAEAREILARSVWEEEHNPPMKNIGIESNKCETMSPDTS